MVKLGSHLACTHELGVQFPPVSTKEVNMFELVAYGAYATVWFLIGLGVGFLFWRRNV